MRVIRAAALLLLLSVERNAVAFDLKPLIVTPVTIEVTIAGRTSGQQTSIASVQAVTEAGTVMVEAAVEGDVITFSSSTAFITTAMANVTVQIETPFVGFTTPVIVQMESFSFERAQRPAELISLHAFSHSLGRQYKVAAHGKVTDRDDAAVFSLIAGDTVELSFRIVGAYITGAQSFSVRFSTAGQTPGAADINGDGTADVLDDVVLRRLLAGLEVLLGE